MTLVTYRFDAQPGDTLTIRGVTIEAGGLVQLDDGGPMVDSRLTPVDADEAAQPAAEASQQPQTDEAAKAAEEANPGSSTTRGPTGVTR